MIEADLISNMNNAVLKISTNSELNRGFTKLTFSSQITADRQQRIFLLDQLYIAVTSIMEN